MSLIELAKRFGIAISTAHDWQKTARTIWQSRMASAVDFEFNQVEQLFSFAWQKLLESGQGLVLEQSREWTDANGAGSETVRRITRNQGAIGWAKVIQSCIELKTKMKGGFPILPSNSHEDEARVAGYTRDEIMEKLVARVNSLLRAQPELLE
jgi:hypothetical protein